ncbi:hypothetical protein SERLADRAFT_405854 [Serpula lacrymans var. lacrymans S7.9]|uniref:Uncharacterized protein n=1 Tax=Serpula lacrymans var. lacrymans (strain S7.9) TaxID=578457 RepID=F8NLN4_SERL9|nr:uncharacterized protein SERLADRAFT_405854 [Serpula lacrymans var. lacrymans S7.9]EGO28215.1 hypothetical protein SERLADRAFT_405854 [Serpula lacrymans var. lacrymans S7.9]
MTTHLHFYAKVWCHSSPIMPTIGITIDALELYHCAHFRNPHFFIQAFIKTLVDLHGALVNDWVLKALRCDLPDWRLKHACLACIYILKGKAPLQFQLLYTMDDNNSLKRASHSVAGFCLIIADMVQSAELAKHPLAVVEKLFDAFGDGLAGGFDNNFHLGNVHAITLYFEQNDTFEIYQNLNILVTGPVNLACAMQDLEVTESLFETWKKKQYLNSLWKEPQDETLKMEYLELLIELRDKE